MRFSVEVSIRGQENTTSDLKEKTIVGRGSQCDLVIKDDGVSRSHLLIEIENKEKVFITDLGSANGTFIGDQKIEPQDRQEYSTFFMPLSLGQNVTLTIVQHAY